MSKVMPSQGFIPKNIGVHTEKYEDLSRKRPVVVEVWYPTHRSGPIDQPEDPAWVHPQEIRDVPIAKGSFPLIMMSHGHMGDRRDRSWLVEYLVKNGFIVASVEHHGNCWKNYNPLLSLRFWERAKDVSFVISELLKDSLLSKHIDPHRIGFIGYSLGGMTGLALGGAKAQNVKEILIQQQESFKEIDLEIAEQIDFSEAQGSFLDNRIKALVLLSPAAFVYQPDSLKNVKVPVALIASEGDEILPFKEHALKVITYLSPSKLKLLGEKSSHYVFLNRVSETGKKMFNEQIYADEIEADRLVVHKEVGDYIAAFFKENL
jgi:predicted dienelactone hydrolase